MNDLTVVVNAVDGVVRAVRKCGLVSKRSRRVSMSASVSKASAER